MNVGKAIYYVLSNATSVTDIAGTRIYPELAEQEAAAPYVVYQIVSVNPDDTNDGPAVIDEVSIDILCVAESYNEAAELATATRAALDRVRGTYNGVNVESIQYDSTDSDVQDSPRRYEQTVTLTVRVFRDAAQIATGQDIEQLTLGRLYDVTDDATTGQVIIKQADGTWAAGDQGTGTGGVDSVNGETGVVTLTTDDISDSGQANKYTTADDITKLAGIEDGAEVNPTAAEVKTLYESNADTNAFTDDEKTKLAGIEAGAQVNDVTSVNGEVGDVDVLFIREMVKNVSGAALYRGTPVHVTGAIGSQAEVIAASASTNYPAHYIIDEDISAGASGYAIALGLISDVDLTPFGDSASNYNEADEVYLGASGGFTTTRPTGTNSVQLLGVVLKVNTGGNQISGYINGMGLVNSLPNLPQGNVWLGDANAAPTATALDTDNVAEGSRLYYTNTRADARIAAANLSDLANVGAIGTAGQALVVDGAGTGHTYATISGLGAVDSVNGQTGVVVLDADDIDDTSTTHKFTTTGDISKLAGIEAGAQVNVATDLTHTLSALTVRVESSTGSDTTIAAASASAAGVMTSADRTKLDGIAAGAEVNVNADWNATSGDAEILNKPTLAAVATSGAYGDLSGTPTIPPQFFYTVSDGATSITLDTGDEGRYIRCTASSAVTVTIPADKFQADDEIIIEQSGTGQVTIAAGSGVTLNNSASNTAKTAERYAVVALKCTATNVFTLTGERELA